MLLLLPAFASAPSLQSPRKGIVLVVVIALLALFAGVALSFVFYAEASATGANYHVQSQTLGPADVDPELLLRHALGQIIYDTNDPYSALRGHSLARNMFGYNSSGGNNQPFNGTGRLRYPIFGGMDNYYAINYQYHDADAVFRDPERYGFRAVKTDPMGQYVGEGGAPWTYPDLESVFLAAVNSHGEVLLPSYTRPWTLAAGGDPKYSTLRPHSSYHSQFSVPDAETIPMGGQSITLDVKNLDWARGVPYWDAAAGVRKYANNDSPWIDFGFPVMTSASGRKYKPLVAPLIMDLDNRVNLWAAGGYRNGAAMPGSQGWGRWEINPQHVMANTSEFNNLFAGSGSIPGRYGSNASADGNRSWTLGASPWYSKFDFDGNGAGKITQPAAGSMLAFPNYPANYDSGSAAEIASHPWNYAILAPQGDDAKPPLLSNFEAHLRLGGKGSTGFTSDIFKLVPQNAANLRTRNMSTFLSFDRNVPGLVPFYTNDPTNGVAAPFYGATFDPTAPVNDLFPRTASVPFPTMTPPPGPPAGNSEFGVAWRSRLAQLSRVNLNRTLRDYPKKPDSMGTNLMTIDLANMADDPLVTQFKNAVQDRQNFALDAYRMLIQITGAQDPNVVTGIPKTDPRYRTARYLAQLAVNIVDFIDTDDFPTPYRWYSDPANQNDPAQWEFVFGTEMPKLVINEFYAQLDNDPLDPNLATGTASQYKVNCWVELHNPLRDTPSGNIQDYPLDRGDARLKIDANNAYRLVVSRADANLRSFDNPSGAYDPAKKIAEVIDWNGMANQQAVAPGNGYYAVQNGSNRGFFCVGPTMSQYSAAPYLARNPNMPTTWATDQMAGTVSASDPLPTELAVVLQRVTCPYVPVNNTSFVINPVTMQPEPNPLYNPYVTMDIMDELHLAIGLNILSPRGYYSGRLFTDTGAVAEPPPAPTEWKSWGRRQPYAGRRKLHARQNPVTPAADQPKHTFFRHNAREDAVINPMTGVDNTTQPKAFGFMAGQDFEQTLYVPSGLLGEGDRFHWLVHLDRQLINPLELLHVSAFPNHELTQRFFNASGLPFSDLTDWLDGFIEDPVFSDWLDLMFSFIDGLYHGTPHKHYAPWLSQDALLYRFFEMSYTPDLVNGVAEGGRTPGKINVNTIWDVEVLRALCDANPTTNYYTLAQINDVWANRLLPKRTAGQLFPPLDTTMQIGGNDRPFWPFGIGYTTAAPGTQYPIDPLNSDRTLFREYSPNKKILFIPADPVDDIFPTSGPHPLEQFELLTKIYNNVTTRSNCFAVWLTIGFFEVVDESARPPKLGAEIGRAENRHHRHRMFALVDRSNLTSNPGPQPMYDPRKDTSVVPYFSVID